MYDFDFLCIVYVINYIVYTDFEVCTVCPIVFTVVLYSTYVSLSSKDVMKFWILVRIEKRQKLPTLYSPTVKILMDTYKNETVVYSSSTIEMLQNFNGTVKGYLLHCYLKRFLRIVMLEILDNP